MYIVVFLYVIDSRADKMPLWVDQDKKEFIVSYGPGACNIFLCFMGFILTLDLKVMHFIHSFYLYHELYSIHVG